MKKYRAADHSFVVCAYKESPYLDTCIRSVLRQTIKSNILITTSTPNAHIRDLSEKYGIPLLINPGKPGLASDWNYGYRAAPTSLVTLVHQDDVYYRNYLANTLTALNGCSHPLLCFTDYHELKNNNLVKTGTNLRIKRLMLSLLRCKLFWKSRFLRRRILSFGNPFCCPSATYVKKNLGDFCFRDNMKSNIDWQAWEELSRLSGEFAYVGTPCMAHRIHPGSTTTEIIGNKQRRKEDTYIFRRFWPAGICVVIEFFYRLAEKSNNL